MTEHPILSSAPMVRAILEGRKTMTRRVIKEFPLSGYRWGGWIVESSNRKETGMATVVPEENSKYCGTGKIGAHCPYGQPGDRLWVRETFACGLSTKSGIAYRATSQWSDFEDGTPQDHEKITWKPSIFMPRWASRITLEVTAVRVERLQDISEADATAEGIVFIDYGLDKHGMKNSCYHIKEEAEKGPDHCMLSARYGFASLWDSINAERGYSWKSNPWTWVVEFKRVES